MHCLLLLQQEQRMLRCGTDHGTETRGGPGTSARRSVGPPCNGAGTCRHASWLREFEFAASRESSSATAFGLLSDA